MAFMDFQRAGRLWGVNEQEAAKRCAFACLLGFDFDAIEHLIALADNDAYRSAVQPFYQACRELNQRFLAVAIALGCNGALPVEVELATLREMGKEFLKSEQVNAVHARAQAIAVRRYREANPPGLVKSCLYGESN